MVYRLATTYADSGNIGGGAWDRLSVGAAITLCNEQIENAVMDDTRRIDRCLNRLHSIKNERKIVKAVKKHRRAQRSRS